MSKQLIGRNLLIRKVAVLAFPLILLGCASSQPAPVIDRAPAAKKTAPPKAPVKQAGDKDWRPDTYIVKKGDTLYSIGLQYGYDYKEIAQSNNIAPPYTIRLGQQLKLKEAKPFESKVVPVNATRDGDVIIAPLKTDNVSPASVVAGSQTTSQPAPSQATPQIKEPRALREPYSDEALTSKPPASKPVAISVPPTAAKPADPAVATETAKTDAPKADTPKLDAQGKAGDEDIDWAWPTTGKVITTFNADSNAKGIDIAGTAGQAVTASAPGKVIYSGSDLRGYGKLVIIKHNKTYLSVYAHNSKILVKEGDMIAKGQKIAEMGNSDTDSVKLHFEIRQQGKSVDPAKYLPAN